MEAVNLSFCLLSGKCMEIGYHFFLPFIRQMHGNRLPFLSAIYQANAWKSVTILSAFYRANAWKLVTILSAFYEPNSKKAVTISFCHLLSSKRMATF
jgi:hypothetical protein